MPTPLDPFAGILLDLRTSGKLPQSRVKGKSLARLQPLIDGGVLESVRAGAGKVFSVRDTETLSKFIDRHFPSGLTEEGAGDAEIDRRTQALSRYRDSKALGGLDFEIVEFLLPRDCPLRIGDSEMHGNDLVHRLGAFILHDTRQRDFPVPSFSGYVATCENPTVFISYRWVKDKVDLVILTYGRMSRRLVNWLTGDSLKESTLTHYGDYDPVGLSEFLRLRERLDERVTLYVPNELGSLFQRYCDRGLLARSSALLPRIAECNDPKVRQVLSLMREWSGALEQEVLIKQDSR